MEKEVVNKVLIIIILIFLFGVSLKFSEITGYAVVEKGETGDAGKQEKNNPNYGALKGTLVLVIKDNGKIISSEDAPNQVISFIEKNKQISDWSLVKEDSGNYKGELDDVDPDGDESKCSNEEYNTKRMYHDANSNNEKNDDEFYIYQITTNIKGCFAVKLPPGEYDIYT